MIYTMLALSLFTIIILIRKYACRHTWFFILMVISLDMALFASVLYISKLGNYRYPSNIFSFFDYKIFRYISNFNFAFFDIVKLMNISFALFLFSVNLFTYQFTMPYSKRVTLKKVLVIVLISILPIFYLWFYDPKTSFDFYIMANTSSGFFLNLVKAIDFFNNIWIPIYLFFPVYLMYKFYRVTQLDIKKKQVIALSICLLILNALFLVLLVTGPFKQIVFTSFSSNSVSFPDSIEIPLYYYDIMPIVMIIIVELMLVLITKYNGFDTVDIFQEIIINRNVRGLNKNLRSIFHSFKNTIFSVKILAEQAKEDYGGVQGKAALDRIEQISNEQFNSMTWMLDCFKEINIVTESNRVVMVIEQALRKVGIGKNIKVVRNYVYPNVKSIFDAYHITEALYNIIQNAVEAIENANEEQGVLKIDVSAEHEWVIIKITDNGIGIKKEALKKIFKPFYTTKSRQNNWGVGLSHSYRVIKANLGFITVDSAPGQYTTFQILLPRADEEDNTNE